VARIRGEVLIERAPEAVFDFVADERNEPRFNPRMTSCTLVSCEPIGVGSRFQATMGRHLPMAVEFTRYEGPRRLASHASLSGAEIDGGLTFEPEGAGTRLRWSWDVTTRGPLGLFDPLVTRVGERRERRVWARLKALLEASPPEPNGPISTN
jgi:Polyketide cyclase / dehydrase and lipid transport